MRLIDADSFLKPREEWLQKELKKNHNEEYRSGYLEGVRVTLFELQDERLAPTVDAEPVRHGHWIDVKNPNWPAHSHDKCSECEWWNTKNAVCRDSKKKAITLRYCPNCGAKMDEVSE